MKKFTFLLTLLALVLGNVQSAFADDAKWTDKCIKSISDPITNLDELTNGFYVIRNVGRKTFVHLEGNGNIWLQKPVQSENTTEIQAAFANNTDVAYAFYVAKDETSGKYTIQGKSGKYFPESLPHGSTASVNETAGNYTIEKITDGQFALKASNYYADGNGVNGSPYSTGSFTGYNELNNRPGANANGAYQFYKVTLGDLYTINYHYKVNGNEVLLVSGVKYALGATPSAAVYPCLTINDYNKEPITKSGDITVDCTMNLPMQASTVEAPKYYAVNMHTGIRKWVANEDGTISCLDVANSLTELPANNQWAFIGTDLLDNFKIYNKATGKYLKSTGSDAATLTDNVNEATSFKVKATRIQNMTNGFCISRGDTYLNYQDNSIKTWNDNDQGSTCTIFTPESFPLNYAKIFIDAPQGTIGGPAYLENTTNFENLQKAYNSLNTEVSDDNIAALVNINKAIADSEVGTQITEGYYRLVNRKDKKYLHIIEGNNIMNTQADKAKAIGSVVYFKKANEEGKFNLMIEGKYLGTVTTSQNINLGDDSNKGTYTVTSNNFITKIQEVSTTNEANNHYLHVNGGNAVGWEAGEGSPASHWYVIPATDIEVAMKDVEGKKFASVYLPFDVNAVTDAEAYVGTFNDDKSALNMNKVEGVPAGKGFVLVGSADKATLSIGTTAEVTSDLQGTNTVITLANDTRANYLVFGKDKDSNAVGFYAPSASVAKIPANKAYLNASALSNAAIALNFNGTTTGVNTVVLGENGVNAPVFDLSGRRVAAPVKGGVYIQNGKKFIK